MSFRDLDVDLESQKSFTDSPEFDSLVDKCSNTLLSLNNHLVTLSKFIKNLEASKDIAASDKVNARVLKLMETITVLFKELSGSNKELAEFEDLNQTKAFTKDKIAQEIKGSLNEFQGLQEKYTTTTNKLNQAAKNALIEDQVHDSQVTQQDQELILEDDVINNEEFNYQQNLIREREEEIQNIEHGIQELNEIFNDLGAIVQEQGTMVDNIESNIYDISGSTRAAASELTRALNYQRRSKRRTFCLLIVLIVILLVVILGILV